MTEPCAYGIDGVAPDNPISRDNAEINSASFWKMKLGSATETRMEQLRTVACLANAYFAVYWVNLRNFACKAVKTIPYFDQVSHNDPDANHVSAIFVAACVMPEDQDKMRAFTNCATVSERLGTCDKIVEEFHGAVSPWEWCRATWTVVSRGDDGLAATVLFAVEDFTAIKLEDFRRERERELMEEQNRVISSLSREYTTVWLVTDDGEAAVQYRENGGEGISRKVIEEARGLLRYEDNLRIYCDRFVCPDDREEFARKTSYEVVVREIQKQPIYSVIYRRNYLGKKEYFQISYTSADGKSGNDFVVGFKNVDDVVLAETQKNEALSEALVAAEYASFAKTEFLSNMSHDIRTPMNAILGFSALAEKCSDDHEAVVGYLQKIQASGQGMLAILNNVLELSHIESGKVVLEESPQSVEVVFDSCMVMMHSEVEKRRHTVRIEKDITRPYVYLDAPRVSEIILNLVSNAVKYTADGGEITCGLSQSPHPEKGWIYQNFSVSDNGIGMSEEFQNHIFESFTRERSTTLSGVQGTGLGMGIVKKLVELMGGTVEIDSALGVGTSISFQIPLRLASYEDTQPKRSSRDGEGWEHLQGKRILLVEDNDLNAEIALALLEEQGLEVDRAADGVQCVERVERSNAGYYDLVLMDVQMPVLDGYRATEKIRALRDKDKASIPIIAMTANAFSEDKARAIEAGMNSHVAKPIDMEALLVAMLEFA